MNRKRIMLLIPAALLPYFALLALCVIFYATDYPVFERIMEQVFHGNGLMLLIILLIYCILAAAFTIIFFVASLREGWDTLLLAKSAVIMKAVQIPAYTGIFLWGVLLAFTIFTVPFSVGLFLIDGLSLILSGLLTAAAAINAVWQGVFQSREVAWVILLQFVFCADVAAAVIFYLKLRKRCKPETCYGSGI